MILFLKYACLLPVLLTSGACISGPCLSEVLEWTVVQTGQLSVVFFLNPWKRHRHFVYSIRFWDCQGLDKSTFIWYVACKCGWSIGQNLLVIVLSMLYVSLAVNTSCVRPIHKAHEVGSWVDSWTRKSICSWVLQGSPIMVSPVDAWGLPLPHIQVWLATVCLDEARHSALKRYVKYGVALQSLKTAVEPAHNICLVLGLYLTI